MSFGMAFQDREFEVRLFRLRAMLAAAIAVIILIVLSVRMLSLQVAQHELFSTLSSNNRLQQVPVAPTRGLVYDRNGVVIAENMPAYHLEITPEDVVNLPATIAALVEVVNVRPSDIELFYQSLKRERRFEPIPLRVNLSESEVAHFSVNRHRFPGVDIEARLSRHYPFGEMTAHVLGYVGRIDQNDLARLDQSNYRGTNHIGKLGVERQYENTLHGRAGYKRIEVNAEGRRLPNKELNEQSKAALPGVDLQLNLDMALQKVAFDALGDNLGAVVALNPNNGAVLVFASTPSFDPHLFVQGISQTEYQSLKDDQRQPLFNRALRGQYPPGSTIKPALGLAALVEEMPQDTITCKGHYRLPTDDRKYRDWKKQGHGKVDLKKAIVESCDVFFYDLAHKMGIDTMAKHLAQFGLGRATRIDLPGESRGLLPNRAWKQKRYDMPWFPGETLITGIGQGYMLITPLQLALLASGLATGRIYQPTLLAAQIDIDGTKTLQNAKLIGKVSAADAEQWNLIRDAMEDVVHGKHGTARGQGYGAKYRFAGKTGTAQVIGIAQDEEYDEEKIEKQYRDHALFIGFAPVTEPQIAIAVLVENGGHGSTAAAPIARKVFDAYLKPKYAGK